MKQSTRPSPEPVCDHPAAIEPVLERHEKLLDRLARSIDALERVAAREAIALRKTPKPA